MKLWLASQIDGSLDKFKQFLGSNSANFRLLFIWTAQSYRADFDTTERPSYQTIQGAGFKTTPYDIKDKPLQEIKEVFEEHDIIHFNGGNVFYLLQQIRQTGCAPILKDMLRAGKVYSGSSAGSCVAGPDISYVAPMSDPDIASGLTDTTGPQLVDISIVPHEGVSPHGPVPREVYDTYGKTHQLVPLRDDQAVAVTENGWEIVS